MLLPIVDTGRLYRIVTTGVGSRSVLFSAKVIYFGVPTLRRSVTVFVVFKTLVDSGVVDSSTNSLRLILLKEFVSINNYISVYKGGEFYH